MMRISTAATTTGSKIQIWNLVSKGSSVQNRSRICLRVRWSWPSSSTTTNQNTSRGIASAAGTTWKVTSPQQLRPRKGLLPRNILLLRHGHSMGNEDESLFGKVADWKIEISARGRLQAQAAGRRIQEIIGPDNPVLFYVSPYKRTQQTLEELQSQLSPETRQSILFIREEPRLREQDFGNFQDPKLIQQFKKERPEFGRFFYRFPNGGESGADVFDRVSAFCGTFLQDLEQCGEVAADSTAVFVTHGITARLFIMKWLHWTVEDFEELHNPPNCGLMHLVRSEDGSSYRLTETSRELIKAPVEEGIGRALKLGVVLKNRKRFKPDGMSTDERRAFDSLAETAWGI